MKLVEFGYCTTSKQTQILELKLLHRIDVHKKTHIYKFISHAHLALVLGRVLTLMLPDREVQKASGKQAPC